jgi:hypothetical protein
MLRGGAMVLSALLLIHCQAQAQTQFDLGGSFETRVGQAPTGLSQNADGTTVPAEQGQVLLIATPAVSLRYLSDVDDLRATSFTRILWRPQPLQRARPLFLETLELSEFGRPSRRSLWRLNLRGSYGEEDYTSLSQQFVSQPTLPSALTVLLVDANAQAAWRATRRADLTLQLLGIHRRTVDSQSAPGSTEGSVTPAFPTQTTVSLAPGVRYLLSRRTTVEASLPIMDSDIGATPQGTTGIGRLNVLSVQPQVGFRRQLSPHHQLHLAAGFAYTVALRRDVDRTHALPPILPLVQVDLTSTLRRTRELQWRSSIGAASNAFVDPVLGVEVLRGTAQARLDLDVGLRWGVGAVVVFATDITGPLPTAGSAGPGGPPGLAPDETVFTAEIPFHYRWPNRFLLQLGGRFAERAPNLRSPNFAWRSNGRELWLFLSVATLPPGNRRPSAPVANGARVNASPQAESTTNRPPPPPVPSPL